MNLLPPLQLLLCSQGAQGLSAELTSDIRTAFRGNLSGAAPYIATLSDLDVPVRSFTFGPPAIEPSVLLDGALHSMVVFIVDDDFVVNTGWVDWVEMCQKHAESSGGRHYVVALCLTEEIKGKLDSVHDTDYSELRGFEEVEEAVEMAREALDGVQHKRPNVFGEYAERSAWIAICVLQRCRALLTRAIFGKDDDRQRLRLFISHAKKDSLFLANSVRFALEKKSFLSKWYDAEDLDGVEDWRKAIREGVQSSVVVVLRTGEYDKRPWCRQEFLWAEQCCVPIVCVEARLELEHRSDTLGTSRVPIVKIPDGNLFRILFPALKESLRILQMERTRKELGENHPRFTGAAGVELIPYTPDLRHLVHASKQIKDRVPEEEHRKGYQVVLYADPPLPTEMYEAARDYLESRCGKTYLLTPTLLPFWDTNAVRGSDGTEIHSASLLKAQPGGAKQKYRVNISVSEHKGHLKALGFTEPDVGDFTVHLAEAIIANEGIVAFGHDWRADGVMQQIYRFAEEHQEIVLREEEREGMVENYAFWGRPLSLAERERGLMRGILDIVPCEKPDDGRLRDFDSLSEVPPQMSAYALARSLTTMRRQMTKSNLARVCLGGRDMDPERPQDGPSGRCPGVVEEAYFSCLYDKPLYLSGLIGGVTGEVIKAFMGEVGELQFKLPAPVAEWYEGNQQRPGETDYDGPIDSPLLLQYFSGYGLKRLSRYNGLTVDENVMLFRAITIEEVRELVLTGLARLVARERR